MGKEKKKCTAEVMKKAKRMVWQGTSAYRAAKFIYLGFYVAFDTVQVISVLSV